jgi:NDP-sugar pyrophosphorylase family protein
MIAGRPGSVRAFVSGASFRDIGTAADYLDTCLDMARVENSGDCLLGHGVTVADDARITDCVLWDDVRVGHGAALDRSVVAGGVSIPDGAHYRRSVIRPRDGHPAEPGEHIVGELLVSRIGWRRESSLPE